jgi:predicted small metal-binding protein
VRVVECDICGETISAANDEELAGRLKDHLASEHEETPTDDDVQTTVDREAYDAMDS